MLSCVTIKRHAKLFPSKTEMPAKTSQDSTWLPADLEAPFVPSLLVEFCKRLTDSVRDEINKMIIAYNTRDDPTPGGGNDDGNEETDAGQNTGTLILRANGISEPHLYMFLQEVAHA